jgi:site-specific DNA-adenine methylase
MSNVEPIKSPFPWFGGKSRAAELIWPRFGNVPNYVEPFAGSLAVLLRRPHEAGTETVNDLDCYLANFWRAISRAPDAVAEHADWPVNEADLLARHRWLVAQTGFRDRMRTDPEYHDAKIAGWWVWGLCSWIGSGWCVQRGDGHQPEQIPHLGDAGMGINRKLPHLGDAGRALLDYFDLIAERLRRVRVACGEWDCVLGESVTVKHGTTAVFLDPPYDSEEHSVTYSAETVKTSDAVREWAIANGENPELRIALCGYDGEHAMPESWGCVAWKAHGGYGSQGNGDGRNNSTRERIWFSPHCLPNPEPDLFG